MRIILNILKELGTHRYSRNNPFSFLYIHVILLMLRKFRLRAMTLALALLKELSSMF